MVLLLARLAHHLLLWGKQWLSRVPTTRRRLRGYGLVRLLRDVWAVPGVIRWRHGWMVSVREIMPGCPTACGGEEWHPC